MEDWDIEVIRAYALKNAIEHNGKANIKAVTNAVIGHYKNRRKNAIHKR